MSKLRIIVSGTAGATGHLPNWRPSPAHGASPEYHSKDTIDTNLIIYRNKKEYVKKYSSFGHGASPEYPPKDAIDTVRQILLTNFFLLMGTPLPQPNPNQEIILQKNLNGIWGYPPLSP